MDIRILEIAKKGRDVKDETNKDVRKELNNEFQKTIKRYKPYYNNACKYVEDGKRYGKTGKSSKSFLNSKGSSNIEFVY